MNRVSVLAAVAVAALAGGGGFWIGHQGGLTIRTGERQTMAITPTTQLTRQPLYYQDPDGKPDYAPAPRSTPDGRAYVPVYEEVAEPTLSPPPSRAAQGGGRILYYRNPMGLPDTSPVPKKDSMRMDYTPVYENDAADAGVVSVSPGRLQMLGVRTALAESRDILMRTVRATGTVQLDERRLAVVTTKVDGWIEKLEVAATGEPVRRDQVLAWIYSPDLVAAENEYLVAAGLTGALHSARHAGTGSLAEAAVLRLRALDVPEEEIARLQRTRQVSRRIAIRAPAAGIVIEKSVIEGMRVARGEPLYRTADLSAVWLLADIQEADIGRIRPGQQAAATFVAFPGQVFAGTVDFIYSILNRESRTARVRIVMPNPDRLLRGDMYASVSVEAATNPDASSMVVVPDSAIIDSGTRQVVLVERGEGKFQAREVRIGARGDGYVQVMSGVTAGERVVVGANFLIDAESNLRAALQTFATPDGQGTATGTPR